MSFDAVVFPGQGAQKKGMASDFYQSFEQAKEVFSQAAKHLDFDVKSMCFDDNDSLNLTVYTQPCIITAEVAMYESLRANCHSFAPSYFAGHSLGEYAALVAAKVLPFEIAIQLVAKRGELMHNANVDGGMAAVIMDELPLSNISEIASQADIDIANDNSKTQVVLSGEINALNSVLTQLEDQFGSSVRCVKLNVSAPFHSRHMEAVEHQYLTYLNEFKDSFNVENAPQVVSNFLGRFYSPDQEEIINALAKQLSGSVKWRDNMQAMVEKSHNILELGPNRPLRGFFKTHGIDIESIINMRSASKVLGDNLELV